MRKSHHIPCEGCGTLIDRRVSTEDGRVHWVGVDTNLVQRIPDMAFCKTCFYALDRDLLEWGIKKALQDMVGARKAYLGAVAQRDKQHGNGTDCP